MRPEQWDTFKRAARLEKLDKIPMALIVDSPWIPGYLGIKHMDYYLDPELWFQSNLKIMREYPDIIMVPSWWMEYGMAAEPSVLGAKIKFWQDNTPSEYHTLYRLEDIDQFPEYEVEADAFAAMTLHRIGMHRQRILDHGYILPMVTSRGPLCTAGFVRSTTNLMIELVENPEGCHKLIDLCTRVIIDWLKAQHKVMGDTVEGIFILDDIVGFINEEHYQEFAHPYLKRICDAFPDDWVKVYHNDAEVDACLDHLPDAGFNVLNWGKQKDIREVKARVGKRMCLMGNVNPLEIAVRGTPDEVRAATLDVLEGSGGEGIILSVGGGVSPGMPRENVLRDARGAGDFQQPLMMRGIRGLRWWMISLLMLGAIINYLTRSTLAVAAPTVLEDLADHRHSSTPGFSARSRAPSCCSRSAATCSTSSASSSASPSLPSPGRSSAWRTAWPAAGRRSSGCAGSSASPKVRRIRRG